MVVPIELSANNSPWLKVPSGPRRMGVPIRLSVVGVASTTEEPLREDADANHVLDLKRRQPALRSRRHTQRPGEIEEDVGEVGVIAIDVVPDRLPPTRTKVARHRHRL